LTIPLLTATLIFMSTIDIIIIFAYFLIVSAYGYWIYRSRQQANASAKGFFLAEGSLTWWAIGASVIASNISAEQIVAMSGSGFHLGLAVAGYEWLAAVTILFVAIFLLPSYLKNKIYTMPQFLNLRFDHRVGNVLTFLWLLIYIFVNLTSIIYLGAFTLEEISGLSYSTCGLMLTFFSLIITIGGMRVIGYTDVIQVLVLVIGCLITVILALQRISGVDSLAGTLTGFQQLIEAVPSHFHMYLKPDHVGYKELPGFSAVFGAITGAAINISLNEL
jgi:solute:Na+ symporter, SSS family